MKININDPVYVKLTPKGYECHYEYYKSLGILAHYSPPKRDRAGWSKWQLWELMMIFGRHCYNGCEPPFAMEIRVGED